MSNEIENARHEVVRAALDYSKVGYEIVLGRNGSSKDDELQASLADQVLADAVKQYANLLKADLYKDSHPLKNRDLGFTELIELKDGATVRDRFGVVWTLKRSGLGTRFFSSVEPVVGVLAGDLERAAKPIKLVSSPTV